jgi:predicted Zn-dependent protease
MIAEMAGLALLPLLPWPSVAQAATDSAHADLRRLVWQRLQDAEAASEQTAGALRKKPGAMTPADSAALSKQAVTMGQLREVLDSMLAEGAWGRAEFEQVRSAYPGNPTLDRYEATLLLDEGQPAAALELWDRELRHLPRDSDLLRGRARALDRLNRGDEALRAWASLLDEEPEDPEAWRALLAAHTARGTLETLLGQIRRLRIMLNGSRLLGEHEIELLHRLGRLDEAAAVARDLGGNP